MVVGTAVHRRTNQFDEVLELPLIILRQGLSALLLLDNATLRKRLEEHAQLQMNSYLATGNVWKPYIQHNCQLDDFGTGFEMAKGNRIGHGSNTTIQHPVGQGGLF